ncbi:MAG TPA: ABC transporter substrate-binding protein [Alphaproteobacteria bacterium]|jgi:putative ABC transport system substrate-binding protein|nr:ABC transporter substrate-binding protein [Alphaproteobacteria bacterium]
MRRFGFQIEQSERAGGRPRQGIETVLSASFGRRRVLTGLLPFLLTVGTSWAAAAGPPARIGWLKIQGPRHTPDQLEAFKEGMRALGLVEGRDYVLEERYANGEGARLPALTTELLGTGVGVIVATSQPSIVAAGRVTKGVPVIGRMNDDPVANGMAHSLARPGGNITGIYAMTEQLNPKRLALLKEAVPSVRLVGVLLRQDWSNAAHDWRVLEAAARQLDLDLLALNARSADELASALELAVEKKVGGIMTFRNPTVVTNLKLIAELCLKHRLPAVFDAREYVEAGGLMSYGPNIDAIYRRLATYVEKLLRGARPGELPIEQPTIFELVLNERTAKTIEVSLPSSLMALADKVIE